MLLIAIGSGHRRTMLLIAIGSGHRRTKLMIGVVQDMSHMDS